MLTERSQQRQDGAAGERADDDRTNKAVPRKDSVEGFEPSDDKCPLRATDGKRKISTVVSSEEMIQFQMACNPFRIRTCSSSKGGRRQRRQLLLHL